VNTADQSLVTNELQAIDWAYLNAQEKGFSVYTYLPSVLDYPYQYLIWWHGKKTYGYLPCEYSAYPKSPKSFIPGSSHYTTPSKPCTNNMFLFIEPDAHAELRNEWLMNVRGDSILLESKQIGNLSVEMREANSR
jgi:hypothetical protein